MITDTFQGGVLSPPQDATIYEIQRYLCSTEDGDLVLETQTTGAFLCWF